MLLSLLLTILPSVHVEDRFASVYPPAGALNPAPFAIMAASPAFDIIPGDSTAFVVPILSFTSGPAPGDPCPYFAGEPPGFGGCTGDQTYNFNELLACQQAYTTAMASALAQACAVWNAANTIYKNCYDNAMKQLDICMHNGISTPSECLSEFIASVLECYNNWKELTDLETQVFNSLKAAAKAACEACYATLCH